MKFFYVFLPALFLSVASFALRPAPIAGSMTGCVGSVNTLNDSIGGGIWTSSNTGVATIGSVSGIVTGVSLGTTVITYTVSDSFVTAVFFVNPFFTPSVSIFASPSDTVCAGNAITFHTTVSYGGSTPDFSWKLNGAVAGILDSFSYYPTAGDTVSVTLTSSAACTMPDTAFSMIEPVMHSSLIPSDSIGATPGVSIGEGEWDTLTAVITGGGSSFIYIWVVNNRVITTATTHTYITDSLANNDSVSCIVVSVGPCGGDTTFNSISISVGPSGIKSPGSLDGVSLFPNPNEGFFTVKGAVNNGMPVDFMLTDLPGRTVYSRSVAPVSGRVNEAFLLGDFLSPGVYLLHIYSGAESRVFSVAVSGK